jgi:electron transfer flavoprotein-quinone oxidoreductase
MNMQPELVGDGVLIAGDAAGMCMNLGFTIRGMDLAISAGEAAAKTVLSAMKRDDFSKQSLGEYRQHLDDGPMRDMRMYQKLPAFLITRACLPPIPKWRSVSHATCSP